MRRVFIIRKDLHLKPGKLAAMIGHCCEAYWTNLIKASMTPNSLMLNKDGSNGDYRVVVDIPRSIIDDYVYGIFTKTVCEARNLNKLNQAAEIARNLGLSERSDFGYIRDKCKTDLVPENPDGTCTVGIWFKPLPDDIAHIISKKFQLYRD